MSSITKHFIRFIPEPLVFNSHVTFCIRAAFHNISVVLLMLSLANLDLFIRLRNLRNEKSF